VALLTPLPETDARRLALEYGLELARVEPLALGSVNSNFAFTAADGRRFFARIYEEQGRTGALAELSLVDALAAAGVPVVQGLSRRDGAPVSDFDGKPFALFPWLEGEILCQGRVTVAACRTLGAALARVHLALPAAAVENEGRFRIADLRLRLDGIEASGRHEYAPDVALIREKLEYYAAARARSAAPRGLIHSDLFRDNVLWRGEQLLALLDFESACQGAFAYDLMVTVCAWCYGSRFEPELVEALLGSYHAVRHIAPAEAAALKVEGAIGCLRFATTRITDFSLRAPHGAAPVRDYRRFLQRLSELEAGALDASFERALV
jgi:homoserine kinase type II